MQDFPVTEYLAHLYQELINAKPNKVELTATWYQTFPEQPGVYLFRDQSEIIYVGETGNICLRMDDLRRTVNHSLRRNIGNQLFTHIDGYAKATQKKRFVDTIEIMLNEHFQSKLTVAVLPVLLGRCELEELIIERHDPAYNKKGKRK